MFASSSSSSVTPLSICSVPTRSPECAATQRRLCSPSKIAPCKAELVAMGTTVRSARSSRLTPLMSWNSRSLFSSVSGMVR